MAKTKRNPVGRPKLPNRQRVTVQTKLDPAVSEKLKELALNNKRSIQSEIAMAVESWVGTVGSSS